MSNMRLKGCLADEIFKELEEDGYKCGEDFDITIKPREPVKISWLKDSSINPFYVKLSLSSRYSFYDEIEKLLGSHHSVSEFIKNNK